MKEAMLTYTHAHREPDSYIPKVPLLRKLTDLVAPARKSPASRYDCKRIRGEIATKPPPPPTAVTVSPSSNRRRRRCLMEIETAAIMICNSASPDEDRKARDHGWLAQFKVAHTESEDQARLGQLQIEIESIAGLKSRVQQRFVYFPFELSKKFVIPQIGQYT